MALNSWIDFLRQRAQNITSGLGKDLNRFSFRGPDLIPRINNQVGRQANQFSQRFQQLQQNPNQIYNNPISRNVGGFVRNIPLGPFPNKVKTPTFGQAFDFFNPPQTPTQQRYISKIGRGGFTPDERLAGNQLLQGLLPQGGATRLGKGVLPKAYQALNHHWSATIGNAGKTFSRNELDNVVSKLIKEKPNSTNEVFRNQAIKISHYINAVKKGVKVNAPFGMASSSIRDQQGKLKAVGLPKTEALAGKVSKVDPFIAGLQRDHQEAMGRMSPAEHRPIPIEINAQEAQTAELNTLMGNQGKGGFRGFSKNLQNDFSGWVNGRNAAEFQKYATLKKWDPIVNPDKAIMDKFHDPQEKVQNFLGKLNTIKKDTNSPVRKFFDQAYKKVTDAGYKVGYKHDYFPQLWENPQQEVIQRMGDRTLSTNPSFSFQSVYENYQKGIKAGLTPKFTNVAELMGWYDGQVQRAVADKNFFQTLAKNSYLRPSSQAPLGWKSLDPDLFPKVKVSFPTGAGRTEYVGIYKAPPELADVINGYLRAPNDKLNAFANIATKLKNFILENGIPGTGINFHGINILVRSALAGNDIAGIPGTGLVKGGAQALHFLINPGAAQKEIDSNLERGAFAVSKGLKLDIEDQVFGKKPGLMGKLFQVPLFQKAIPALKIKSFNTIYDNLAKSMDSDTAAREASKIVNNIYGGMNWEQLGRSRQTQALLRSIIFAPDFQESNLKLGGGIIKSLFDPANPVGAQYRQIARNLLYMYMGTNVLNHHTSGKWMLQNDPGHSFDIQIGYNSNGQKRYFRPFGTAADFIRIPFDVATSLAKGDTKTLRSTVANRVSAPLAAGARFALNVDQFGRPVRGTGDTILNTVGQVANTLLPQYGEAATNYITGKQSGEQSVAQALGLPLRYSGGPSTKAQNTVASYLKQQGASGKEINGVIQYYRNHTALNKVYTEYNNDTTKAPDFVKNFKKLSQSDKVINLAWQETSRYIQSSPQATDDQIIRYAKKRLDYYNKQVDKTYKYPAQYVTDQQATKDIQKLSPKAQKTLRKRIRKEAKYGTQSTIQTP